jgi:DNA-binding MarR family transcriptional regulator
MDSADMDRFSTSTLMRAARGVYAQSMRAHLHAVGVDDLPRNGAFVLVGIADAGGPRQDLPAELGVTKQAVNQVIDTLVARGYVERSSDLEDRRRNTLTLTERGVEALEAVVSGVEAVDRLLEEQVSAEDIRVTRRVLVALSGIKVDRQAAGASRRRPRRLLRRFSPIFPVGDLGAALAHYTALGFKTFAYEDGQDYGFANRDRLSVHLGVLDGHSGGPGAAYLDVNDADALYDEWSRPDVGGETFPVGPTAYGMREGSHRDPFGNLIRFGSPIEE